MKRGNSVRMDWEIADYMPPSTWLRPLLEGLTAVNQVYLRASPLTPNIYESGVGYALDPRNERGEQTEVWQDIPHVIHAGRGDCKKLSAWRAAELRERHGIHAIALPVMQTTRGGVLLVHVIVQLPDGRTEDPSRLLGMGRV